jgi:hypothetical protein
VARSTAAEADFRINTVYGLLVDGKSRGDVVRFCAENWEVGDRQADNYIAKARKLIERDCELSRPQFLAEALAGLRSIRQQAERRGQMQVAINAIRLQAELVGMAKQ